MFGRHKNSEENTSTRPPLIFHGVNVPEPTSQDRKWANKFAREAHKGNISQVRKMLDEATEEKQLARIAAGLRIQYQHPKQDFLRGGFSTGLTKDIWCADIEIAEMYINTYTPTSSLFLGHDDMVTVIRCLTPETKENWVEKGAGECLTAILCAYIEDQDTDRVKKLLTQTNIDVTDKCCKAIKSAIQSKNKAILNAVLDAMPDYREPSTNLFILPAIEKADRETLDILIKRDFDLPTYKDNTVKQDREVGKPDVAEILEDFYKRQSLVKREKNEDSPDNNWVALGQNYAQYSPATDDRSQVKYQFDFNSGYMAYIYSQPDLQVPPALKPLSEVHRENPHFIEKAVEVLVNAGHPMPEFAKNFNQAAPKTITQARAPANTTAAPANSSKKLSSP